MALATEGFSTYVLKNQIKSVILLMGFPVLLLLMIFAFFFLMGVLMQAQPPAGSAALARIHLVNYADAWHYGWRGVVTDGYWALIVSAVWFAIAWFFHASMIRAACGAVPVTRKQMPHIYNTLENLCISRGMTMPQLQVIDSPALNAFASGISESSYSITLTRGIIEALHDDELEAVLGHELTHIRNRDVRLLMVAVIFVGMISFFSHMLWRVLVYGVRPNYYVSRDNRGSGLIYLLIIAIAFVVLAIGYFFAIVIRFALSRKREFLADAGSVELTKNPEALMRALLRISGHDVVSSMPQQVQQMCIENSVNFMGLFATHPPIEERLDAIKRTTGVDIPVPAVSLRRKPTSPWKDGVAPDHPSTRQTPPMQPLWGFPPQNEQDGAGQ